MSQEVPTFPGGNTLDDYAAEVLRTGRRFARRRPASFGLLAGIQPSTFIVRPLIGIPPVPLYLRNRSFVSR